MIKNLDTAAIEYREKHKNCWYCDRRSVAPCGHGFCTISNKSLFPSFKAKWCKNYIVREVFV